MKSVEICTLLLLSAASLCCHGQITRYIRTGPTVMVGMANLENDSESGRYHQYIYNLINSTWTQEINSHMDTLALGVVQIRYVVHADGTVTDMTVLLGQDLGPLTIACQRAITAHVPFKQFDSALLKKCRGADEEYVTFTAENDPAHSGNRIEKLRKNIPTLEEKLKFVSQDDHQYIMLRNQLDSDKWELELLAPSAVVQDNRSGAVRTH